MATNCDHDLVYNTFDTYNHNHGTRYQAICRKCGEIVWVEPSEVPTSVPRGSYLEFEKTVRQFNIK